MTELAEAIASLVGPYLPTLIARGEALLEEAEVSLAPDLRRRVQRVWSRLDPSVRSGEAARNVAARPDDAQARADFELQILEILNGNSSLAEEMRELVESGDLDDLGTVPEAVEAVRAAFAASAVEPHFERVVEADLAIVIDEAVRSPHENVILRSRVDALASLAHIAVGEPRARIDSAVAGLARALGMLDAD